MHTAILILIAFITTISCGVVDTSDNKEFRLSTINSLESVSKRSLSNDSSQKFISPLRAILSEDDGSSAKKEPKEANQFAHKMKRSKFPIPSHITRPLLKRRNEEESINEEGSNILRKPRNVIDSDSDLILEIPEDPENSEESPFQIDLMKNPNTLLKSILRVKKNEKYQYNNGINKDFVLTGVRMPLKPEEYEILTSDGRKVGSLVRKPNKCFKCYCHEDDCVGRSYEQTSVQTSSVSKKVEPISNYAAVQGMNLHDVEESHLRLDDQVPTTLHVPSTVDNFKSQQEEKKMYMYDAEDDVQQVQQQHSQTTTYIPLVTHYLSGTIDADDSDEEAYAGNDLPIVQQTQKYFSTSSQVPVLTYYASSTPVSPVGFLHQPLTQLQKPSIIPGLNANHRKIVLPIVNTKLSQSVQPAFKENYNLQPYPAIAVPEDTKSQYVGFQSTLNTILSEKPLNDPYDSNVLPESQHTVGNDDMTESKQSTEVTWDDRTPLGKLFGNIEDCVGLYGQEYCTPDTTTTLQDTLKLPVIKSDTNLPQESRFLNNDVRQEAGNVKLNWNILSDPSVSATTGFRDSAKEDTVDYTDQTTPISENPHKGIDTLLNDYIDDNYEPHISYNHEESSTDNALNAKYGPKSSIPGTFSNDVLGSSILSESQHAIEKADPRISTQDAGDLILDDRTPLGKIFFNIEDCVETFGQKCCVTDATVTPQNALEPPVLESNVAAENVAEQEAGNIGDQSTIFDSFESTTPAFKHSTKEHVTDHIDQITPISENFQETGDELVTDFYGNNNDESNVDHSHEETWNYDAINFEHMNQNHFLEEAIGSTTNHKEDAEDNQYFTGAEINDEDFKARVEYPVSKSGYYDVNTVQNFNDEEGDDGKHEGHYLEGASHVRVQENSMESPLTKSQIYSKVEEYDPEVYPDYIESWIQRPINIVGKEMENFQHPYRIIGQYWNQGYENYPIQNKYFDQDFVNDYDIDQPRVYDTTSIFNKEPGSHDPTSWQGSMENIDRQILTKMNDYSNLMNRNDALFKIPNDRYYPPFKNPHFRYYPVENVEDRGPFYEEQPEAYVKDQAKSIVMEDVFKTKTMSPKDSVGEELTLANLERYGSSSFEESEEERELTATKTNKDRERMKGKNTELKKDWNGSLGSSGASTNFDNYPDIEEITNSYFTSFAYDNVDERHGMNPHLTNNEYANHDDLQKLFAVTPHMESTESQITKNEHYDINDSPSMKQPVEGDKSGLHFLKEENLSETIYVDDEEHPEKDKVSQSITENNHSPFGSTADTITSESEEHLPEDSSPSAGTVIEESLQEQSSKSADCTKSTTSKVENEDPGSSVVDKKNTDTEESQSEKRNFDDEDGQLASKKNTLLKATIKQVINDFASEKDEDMVQKNLKSPEIVGLNVQELLPEIINIPILRSIFSSSLVENMLLNTVKDVLLQNVKLSKFNPISKLTDDDIKWELKNAIANIKNILPNNQPIVVQEHTFKHGNWIIEPVTLLPTASAKDKTIYPFREVLNRNIWRTINSILSESPAVIKDIKQPIVQKVIAKTVKNELKKEKDENLRLIKDSLILKAVKDVVDKLENDEITQTPKTISDSVVGQDLKNNVKDASDASLYEEKTSLQDCTTSSKNIIGNHVSDISDSYDEEGSTKISIDSLKNQDSSTVGMKVDYNKENPKTAEKTLSTNEQAQKLFENSPIKYYSPHDRILEYIKEHGQDNFRFSNAKVAESAEDSEDTEILQETGKNLYDYYEEYYSKDSENTKEYDLGMEHYVEEEEEERESLKNDGITKSTNIKDPGKDDRNINTVEATKDESILEEELKESEYADDTNVGHVNHESVENQMEHIAENPEVLHDSSTSQEQTNYKSNTDESHKSREENAMNTLVKQPYQSEEEYGLYNEEIIDSEEPEQIMEEYEDYSDTVVGSSKESLTPPLSDSANDNVIPHVTSIDEEYVEEKINSLFNSVKEIKEDEGVQETVSSTCSSEFDRDHKYLGKIITGKSGGSENNLSGLTDSDLYYIGDGVKLPLTIKKLKDGSYAISISESICDQIINKQCPCCVPPSGKIVQEKKNMKRRDSKGIDEEFHEENKEDWEKDKELKNRSVRAISSVSKSTEMSVDDFTRKYNLTLNLFDDSGAIKYEREEAKEPITIKNLAEKLDDNEQKLQALKEDVQNLKNLKRYNDDDYLIVLENAVKLSNEINKNWKNSDLLKSLVSNKNIPKEKRTEILINVLENLMKEEPMETYTTVNGERKKLETLNEEKYMKDTKEEEEEEEEEDSDDDDEVTKYEYQVEKPILKKIEFVKQNDTDQGQRKYQKFDDDRKKRLELLKIIMNWLKDLLLSMNIDKKQPTKQNYST